MRLRSSDLVGRAASPGRIRRTSHQWLFGIHNRVDRHRRESLGRVGCLRQHRNFGGSVATCRTSGSRSRTPDAMFPGGGVRFGDVTDGLSNTAMACESSYVTGSTSTRWGGSATPAAPGNTTDWPTWLGAPGSDECIRTNARFSNPINALTSPQKMCLVRRICGSFLARKGRQGCDTVRFRRLLVS